MKTKNEKLKIEKIKNEKKKKKKRNEIVASEIYVNDNKFLLSTKIARIKITETFTQP